MFPMITAALVGLFPLISAFAPPSKPFSSKTGELSSETHNRPYRQNQESAVVAAVDPREIHFDDSVRVMSFNILIDGGEEEHPWAKRHAYVASMIRFHHADLIGLQEVSSSQFEDLERSLSEFELYEGSYNPILFRRSRFEKVGAGSFYLSMTPDQPSLGWDARFPRVVSWVKLKDKKLNQEFVVFNTHFDYHGHLARNESAKLLGTKVREIAGSCPYVVTGDFNLFPQLGGKKTYKLLTETFRDAHSSSQFPHHGPTGTWSGFKEAGQPGVKPDCIFVSPKVEVYLHGILGDTFDGEFPSDHLPVVADLYLQ